MNLPWKSIALCGLLVIPMLISHTLTTATERNSANAQLIAAQQMQTTLRHNHAAEIAQIKWSAKYASIECAPATPPPRPAIRLADYKHPPAQLALNFAAHDSGLWTAALGKLND